MHKLSNRLNPGLGWGKTFLCVFASAAVVGCGSDSAPTLSQLTSPVSSSDESVALLGGDPISQLSFSPVSVCPGDTLSITGADLQDPLEVFFSTGPLSAPVGVTSFDFTDRPLRDLIEVTVPGSAATGRISVELGSNTLESRLPLVVQAADGPVCDPPDPTPTPTPPPPPTAPEFESNPVGGATIDVEAPDINNTGTTLLRVSNVGTADLIISSAEITGPDAGFISISSTVPSPIVPDGFGDIVIECDPNRSDDDLTATLTLMTNDDGGEDGVDESTVTYPITCGANVPSYDSNPAPSSTIVFPAVETLGNQTSGASIQIFEDGREELVVNFGDITGDFSVVNRPTDPTDNFPIDIPDGGAPVTLDLLCDPTVPGTRTGVLTLFTNDPDQPTVTYDLSCLGLNPVPESVPPNGASINFGFVPPGDVRTQSIEFTNTGDAPLDLTATFPPLNGNPQGFFGFSSNSTVADLPPGASTTLVLTCAPTGAPVLNGELNVATNSQGPGVDGPAVVLAYDLLCASGELPTPPPPPEGVGL